MADNAELERQRDALDRTENLLTRAQTDPLTPIGDQTIVAEIVAIRSDLLAEIQRRHDAERTFVLRHEFDPIKAGFKWAAGVTASLIAVVAAFWLGKQ